MEALEVEGYEVLRLKDYLPINAPDPDVLAKAQELDAIPTLYPSAIGLRSMVLLTTRRLLP